MKRLIVTVLNILGILMFALSQVLNYFTTRKMGMARHMSYLNNKLAHIFDMKLWTYISFAVLILLGILLITVYIKHIAKGDIKLKLWLAVFAIYEAYFIYFTLSNSISSIRSYYFAYTALALGYICILASLFCSLRSLQKVS